MWPQYEQSHDKVILLPDSAWPLIANPDEPYIGTPRRRSYPTCHIPQIMDCPVTTSSVKWHIVWLINSSTHMKNYKRELIRGKPQKMNGSTKMVFTLYQEDMKKAVLRDVQCYKWYTGNHFFTIKWHFIKNTARNQVGTSSIWTSEGSKCTLAISDWNKILQKSNFDLVLSLSLESK